MENEKFHAPISINKGEYYAYGISGIRLQRLSGSLPEVRNGDGSNSIDLRFYHYRIMQDKPTLSGLPAAFAFEEESQTLEMILEDRITGIHPVLLYSVLAEKAVIPRSIRIENAGSDKVVLEQVLSCCLNFQQPRNQDFITF